MQQVLLWAKNICVASVGCALIGFLLPKGNLEKTGKTLLGLFLLWMMFTPFAEHIRSASFAEITLPAAEESLVLSDSVADYAAKQAEYQIKKILDENEIAYGRVTVECHIEQDGVININRIEITTGGDVQTVTELVVQKTGLEPVILRE